MIKNLNECAPEKKGKYERIGKLLANEILHSELIILRDEIEAEYLSYIIQKIYDLNERFAKVSVI